MKTIDTRFTDYVAMGDISDVQKTAQKNKGQFFTPLRLPDLWRNRLRYTILSYLCLIQEQGQEFLQPQCVNDFLQKKRLFKFRHTFENDPDILPVLEENMAYITSVFQETLILSYMKSSQTTSLKRMPAFLMNNIFLGRSPVPRNTTLLSQSPIF